jgi:NTP pyrophosphatase (non-canonical NTP hydrolase)
MPDSQITLADLRQRIQSFVDERDWRQFHRPKNLAMSIAIEAAELMEHFQWVDNDESHLRAMEDRHRRQIAEEIADVACYLLSLANAMQLDLSDAVLAKLRKNVLKYPAAEFRGKFEKPG